MIYDSLNDICQKVLGRFGFQYNQTQEELSELETTIYQSLRGRDVELKLATELVDALIMVNQLAQSQQFYIHANLIPRSQTSWAKYIQDRDTTLMYLADRIIEFKAALMLGEKVEWDTNPETQHYTAQQYTVPAMGIVPDFNAESCVDFNRASGMVNLLESVLEYFIDPAIAKQAYEGQMQKLSAMMSNGTL